MFTNIEDTNPFGKQSINFEQVLGYNPEIILVYEKKNFIKQFTKILNGSTSML